eukprot:TRINITY_DN5693_c0_g1_i1.p1 TRINITY_DN5693_c0_g1~~TRINITY_DN5693_c0_g1_i1.p1  ORF type:complete len:286 (+),score=28.77 TRINITY_DN5693_c0_g1_i1:22-858(+)
MAANLLDGVGGSPSATPNYYATQQNEYGSENGSFFADLSQQMIRRGAADWLTANSSYMSKYLQNTNFKYYFCVNNRYVAQKIGLILFPVMPSAKSFARRKEIHDGAEVFKPPRDDRYAPDLYIPAMAFVTYCILYSLIMGLANKFTPEMIAESASRGTVALFIQIAFLKFCFYILPDTEQVFTCDIVAYTGYIFVSLCVNLIAGLIGGAWLFYIVSLVTSLFMSVFLVKTMKVLVHPRSARTGELVAYRNHFLFATALFPFLWAYLLGEYVRPSVKVY